MAQRIFLMLMVAWMAAPAQIEFPDTVKNEGCSGSLVYDYSVNCDGDKDPRAIFTWFSCKGDTLQKGTRGQQANQYRITQDSACVFLEVSSPDTFMQSNAVVWVNRCLVSLPEHVLANDEIQDIYDWKGRKLNQKYKDLEAGRYIVVLRSGRRYKLWK